MTLNTNLTGLETLEVLGQSATGIPANAPFTTTTKAIADLGAGDGSLGYVVWQPSDPTGATNMATELEAFVASHQGYTVRIPDNATVLLNNAFKTVTTGSVFLDFGQSTVLYDHQTNNDAAIYLDNTENSSGTHPVTSIANVTINSDAYVTQITMGTALSVNRFDWLAFTSTNANPAQAGGVLGEIFQAMTDADVTNTVFSATRVLNRFSQYSTGMALRRLDTTRKVYITGGTFQANGISEDHSITARADGIRIRGYVNPIVHDVVFNKPWSVGIRFVCNAAPRWWNITMQNTGNMAAFNGFIYGVDLYGMNDSADGRNIVTKNGRHPAFTTDGDSNNSTSWFLQGIPTNFNIDGVHGINCNGPVVDTHPEGDGGHISNISSWFQYQDADIAPNFSGCTVQHRCANTRFSNIFGFGGTNGIKITAVDHGFTDQVQLDNVFFMNTTSSADTDIGINIFDQSALANKRQVYLNNASFNNVGECIFLGRTALLKVGTAQAFRCKTWLDAGEGSTFMAYGDVTLDFTNDPRGAAYNCNIVRSSLTNGGATVIYLRKPTIVKGTATNQPMYFFEEHDTTANKTIWCPGLTEYNPSNVTSTQVYKTGATTLLWANITNPTNRSVRVVTATGAITTLDSDDIIVVNKTVGAASAISIMAPGIPGRQFTYKDGKGDAGANNMTITPTSGTIDGGATLVISANYGKATLVDNGTQWNQIG